MSEALAELPWQVLLWVERHALSREWPDGQGADPRRPASLAEAHLARRPDASGGQDLGFGRPDRGLVVRGLAGVLGEGGGAQATVNRPLCPSMADCALASVGGSGQPHTARMWGPWVQTDVCSGGSGAPLCIE